MSGLGEVGSYCFKGQNMDIAGADNFGGVAKLALRWLKAAGTLLPLGDNTLRHHHSNSPPSGLLKGGQKASKSAALRRLPA